MLRHLIVIFHFILSAVVDEEAEVQRGVLSLPTVAGGRAGTLEPCGELGGVTGMMAVGLLVFCCY